MIDPQARAASTQVAVRAERAFDAAAESLEARIHRRDRLAGGHPPGGAAPDQQAAQRHDEGGDRRDRR